MEVKVTKRDDLRELELSETRIILLYSTRHVKFQKKNFIVELLILILFFWFPQFRNEGSNIMRWAKEAGLTGKSYVWIGTQSVIGETKDALPDFPAGMLGK